jgi:transcriptional regulator with XRE-family HTH domain
MSTDYYSRIERERGPQPSEQMIASIAQGLHLSLDERDHLFHLAGHRPPDRGSSGEHISPGMLRIFDRLGDTPAEIVTEIGESLRQTPPAVALLGDLVSLRGPARSLPYRWFTDPSARDRYEPDDHDRLSRVFVSNARAIASRRGPDSPVARLVDVLLDTSEEFRSLWDEHQVGLPMSETKRFKHPEVGTIELHCQTLVDPDHSHLLLVYTAVPGTESHEKLQLLSVIGAQSLT